MSHLLISSTESPFNDIKELFSKSHRDVVVIAPYVKTDVLRKILPNRKLKITIITSWKINDILFGASDTSLFPFCKEVGANLFLNNRIHLKVYMSDWQKIISGSANVTNNGLGISPKYNYELNSEHHSIDKDTLLYLKSILHEATLVTDDLYLKFKKVVEGHPPLPKIEEIDITPRGDDNSFLISSLPMSRDVYSLFDIYNNDLSSSDKELLDCAIHDTVLYEIPLGLSKTVFLEHVKRQFFESRFVIRLLDYIGEEGRYFGRVKEWIQSNCHDVPVPSRRDLTGNVQVLYKWIVELSDGKYLVDRPNHSERIYKAK